MNFWIIIAALPAFFAGPAVFAAGSGGRGDRAGPVTLLAARGRVVIKPRMKYEIPISMDALKTGEWSRIYKGRWIKRMRGDMSLETMRDVEVLLKGTHWRQLANLMRDYDGPDRIEDIARFIRADKNHEFKKWAKKRKPLMKELDTAPRDFPGWYAGLVERFYAEAFGRAWREELRGLVLKDAEAVAVKIRSLETDPTVFMERLTGRRFPEGVKVVMYPSSFLPPSNAARTKEPGGRAVIYRIGREWKITLNAIFHELLHPLMKGWEKKGGMRTLLKTLGKDPLFKKEFEESGQAYSYPYGWVEELFVHSVANYMNVKWGEGDEVWARSLRYSSYEDALYFAIFDRYDEFESIDAFMRYAMNHIHPKGSGPKIRFEYSRK